MVKKLAKILILSAVLLININLRAGAVVLDSQFITEKVRTDIINSLKKVTDGRVEVTISPLPYGNINVPPGNIDVKTDVDVNNLRSSTIARVSIYVDNVNLRNFGVKADIKVYDKVWVAKDRITKDSALGSVRLEEKEVSAILNRLPGKEFVPGKYIARRNLEPGKIIEISDVEGVPTIVRNSPVSVIFKSQKIAVTVPATAMTGGKIGDFIKVRSDAYKKIYVGKIIGENVVLVNI